MIANIDDNVGRLLAKLKEWGIERNTLIIYMNDNGGTAGVEVWNAGMRGHKGTPWKGGTRGDVVLAMAGDAPAGRRRPTRCTYRPLSDAGGTGRGHGPRRRRRQVRRPQSRAALADPDAPWPDRFLFTHVGRWGKGKAADSKYLHCRVRNGRYSLVCNTKDGSKHWELFDLKTDYGEKNNVAAEHPEIVKQMDEAYDRWWQNVLPCLENEDAVGPAVNPFKELYEKQFGSAGPATPRRREP